jgi:hypothetical protein
MLARMKKAIAWATLLVACGGSMDTPDTGTPTPDSGVRVDAGGVDAQTPQEDAGQPMMDSGPPMEDAGMVGCGTSLMPSEITGTEGLVIARDGTVYYSQTGGVGRKLPGMAAEDDFVRIAGASTVWGVALNAANTTLYVAVPSAAGGGAVYSVDLTAADPSAVSFYPSAGQANGITVGPDGAVYYSNFGAGRVYRIDVGGTRTEVTTSTIAGANGVAFEDSGTLLVDSYSDGTLIRLTLTAGVETARATVASSLGSPDGVAVAADGTIYVSDNSGGRVLRIVGSSGEVVSTGRIGAAASLEFGSGAVNCEDLYVASSGNLGRVADLGPGRAVPWH